MPMTRAELAPECISNEAFRSANAVTVNVWVTMRKLGPKTSGQ